jgi:50S ribosome-binding GTPase
MYTAPLLPSMLSLLAAFSSNQFCRVTCSSCQIASATATCVQARPTFTQCILQYSVKFKLLNCQCTHNSPPFFELYLYIYLHRRVSRGINPRSVRVAVIGYPNVGKSALINQLVGKAVAQSRNIPGVTRKINWIRLAGQDTRVRTSNYDRSMLFKMYLLVDTNVLKVCRCNLNVVVFCTGIVCSPNRVHTRSIHLCVRIMSVSCILGYILQRLRLVLIVNSGWKNAIVLQLQLVKTSTTICTRFSSVYVLA